MLIILIGIFSLNKAMAQSTAIDSISHHYKSKRILQKSLLPTTLIAIGLAANHSQFEKQLKIDLRNKVGNNFELKIDDYMQFVPIVEMYGAAILGVKAKNHWFDQTKYLLISNLISSTITHGIKRLTLKIRPNGSPYSFPSGHTTFAFTNASVLYNEFRENSPILAYSGFAFATTTGVFRMINNKHWFSDVMVGAGIGILVTELVYHFEPLKHFNPFKKSKNISFIPQFNSNEYSIYFAYSF